MDAIRSLYNVTREILSQVGHRIDEDFLEEIENALVKVEEEYFTLDSEEDILIEEREDNFLSDSEADADVLKSIGWGTDEDYNESLHYCD